jgi:uncharacterized protein (TIGR03067 family)
MRTVLLIAILAVAAPIREDQRPKEKEKTLQEQVIGTWQSVKVIEGGKEVDISLKVVFTPTEAQLYENDGRKMDMDATWIIDAMKDPATIDLNPKMKGEKKELGILKIEGDVLTVCVVEDGDGPRPPEFKSPADSKVVLLHFKRVPK